MTIDPLLLVVPAAAVLFTAIRYLRAPARRQLAARFLHNKPALKAGGAAGAVLLAANVRSGSLPESVFVAIVLGLLVAAGYDRYRPITLHAPR